MGIFGNLKLSGQVAASNVLPFPVKPTAISSPWTDSSALSHILTGELVGIDAKTTSRLEALRVPAVSKGRAILHSLIASRPLRAYNDQGPLETQPTWLYRSDTGISPYLRITQILDDLIFNEASLLAVSRGSVGQILDAVVVPYDQWAVDDAGVIRVRDRVADADQVVYIPGPSAGLLVTAQDTITAAREMDRAWAQRVRNPLPMMILKEREDNGMTEAEARAYVKAVAAARRNLDGGVAFLPFQIDIDYAAAKSSVDLYESGRNALRLDIANYFNLPAALLDGSVSTASLTYSTQEGRRNEIADYTLDYWTEPIEQALSLDNVVPRGTRVRFDFTDLYTTTASPTGAPEED